MEENQDGSLNHNPSFSLPSTKPIAVQTNNFSQGEVVALASLWKSSDLHHPWRHPQYAQSTQAPTQQFPVNKQRNEPRVLGSCLTAAAVEDSGPEVAAHATPGMSIKAATRALVKNFFITGLSFGALAPSVFSAALHSLVPPPHPPPIPEAICHMYESIAIGHLQSNPPLDFVHGTTIAGVGRPGPTVTRRQNHSGTPTRRCCHPGCKRHPQRRCQLVDPLGMV